VAENAFDRGCSLRILSCLVLKVALVTKIDAVNIVAVFKC
jgi:hypothetical protein